MKNEFFPREKLIPIQACDAIWHGTAWEVKLGGCGKAVDRVGVEVHTRAEPTTMKLCKSILVFTL